MDNNQYPTQPIYNDQPEAAAQPAVQPSKAGRILSIVSLVCGICAMVFCWIPVTGLMCGIAAIILASIARKKGVNGMNKTGMILGIIGTVLGGIMTIVILAASAGSYNSYDYYYYFNAVRSFIR